MLPSVPRAVVLLGGAVSFVSAAAVPGPLREYTFDAYLRDFGKRYADPEERLRAKRCFFAGGMPPRSTTLAAASSYTRAVNHLSDWTEEELQGIKGLDKALLHYQVGQRRTESPAPPPRDLQRSPRRWTGETKTSSRQ